MKDFCNNIYKDLVSRLGELQINIDQLSKEKEAINAQLRLLNALSPELQKLEKPE
jgi:chaperonin cofactor prefoldin